MHDAESRPRELTELELEQLGGALAQELASFGVGNDGSDRVFELAPMTIQAMSKVIHIVQIGAAPRHNMAILEEAKRLLLTRT